MDNFNGVPYMFKGEQFVALGGNYYGIYRVKDGDIYRCRCVLMYLKKGEYVDEWKDFGIVVDPYFLKECIKQKMLDIDKK